MPCHITVVKKRNHIPALHRYQLMPQKKFDRIMSEMMALGIVPFFSIFHEI